MRSKRSVWILLVAALSLVALFLCLPTPQFTKAEPIVHSDWQHNQAIQLNEQTASQISAGNYYLESDLELSSFISISEEVSLCLNGYRLTLSNGAAISIEAGGSLTLYDCEEETCQENGHTHKGEITGATSSAITVYGGSFTMYGGTIAGNNFEYDDGGGVSIRDGGSFIMEGGTITGNTADSGGGVYVMDGTFTMNGGAITNNIASGTSEADQTFAGGGGVYVENGTVELNGGTISGNQAANGHGGGILLNATQTHYDAQQNPTAPSIDFSLSGETVIADNTAQSGGGIAALGGVTAEMTDGLIGGKAYSDGTTVNGNTATGNSLRSIGGGVYLRNYLFTEMGEEQDLVPAFTMSGGTIGLEIEDGAAQDGLQGNTSGYGGGVGIENGGLFTLENGVIGDVAEVEALYGNSAGGNYDVKGDGVYLYNGGRFTMTGGSVCHHENEGIVADHSGEIDLNGGEIKGNNKGVYLYEGGELKMSNGTITENDYGVDTHSSMIGNSKGTITGGKITGNSVGYNYTGEVTLGGTAFIKDNIYSYDEPSYPQNFVMTVSTPINFQADFAGDVGLTLHATDAPFSNGFQEGMLSHLTFDGLQGGVQDGSKITPVEVTRDDGSGQSVTVTELALTYRVTFLDGEREIEGLSGDYIAGQNLQEILCEYDEATQAPVLSGATQTALLKDPDETNHYTFEKFTQEDGSDWIAESDWLSVDSLLTINVIYTEEAHNFDPWQEVDEETHSHTCSDCQYTESAPHVFGAWGDRQDGTHARVCEDCSREEIENHSWGAWTTDGEETHSRTCTQEGCTAKQTENHTWGAWSSDGEETHSRTCTQDGCNAKQTENHTWGAWSSDGEETHSRTCTQDGCNAKQTENHTWGAWSSDGEETHSRTCTQDGCNAKQTENHTWGAWLPTEGETKTRECLACSQRTVEPDDRGKVVAARLLGQDFTPYYDLQLAFDEAEAGETVYLVHFEEGTAIGKTLVLSKPLVLQNVTRTVGAEFRAVYKETNLSVTFTRADGFAGALLRIERGASLTLDHVNFEGGDGTAIELLGALTILGGSIQGEYAVKVLSTSQTVSHFADYQEVAAPPIGENAALSLKGTPTVGKIYLDNPSDGEIPAVDLTDFSGQVTVEISEDRPYGVFAMGLHAGAELSVLGGANRKEGLSAREVRLQEDMALCGGYDLALRQDALGEVTLLGECDEYLNKLSVFVNGEEVVLSASGGAFEITPVSIGEGTTADLSVGGERVSFGVVSFNERTGEIYAPSGATYEQGGAQPLAGADPLAFALGSDGVEIQVDGKSRTLDFRMPVGAAFVDRYLSDGGVVFSEVNLQNFERVRAGEPYFEKMTEGQKAVVNEKLAGSAFSSFEELLLAVDAYLAAQNQKVNEFFEANETVSKNFDSVTGGDRAALDGALQNYFSAGAEERHFLDETAKEDGYSGFQGKVEDMIAKSEFEEAREETVENLGTILRGCDGQRVREQLSIVLETVESAVYERCTEDDLRLEYLAGKKDSLASAVRVLQNAREEERDMTALQEYVQRAQESGRYEEKAIEELFSIVDKTREKFEAVDLEQAGSLAQLEEIFEEGVALLNAVRAHTLSSGDFSPLELPEYQKDEEIFFLIGMLSGGTGFCGDSALSLRLSELSGAQDENDFVALFGVIATITGDRFGGTFSILLPEQARGYLNYRLKMGNTLFPATVEGNLLVFSVDDLLSAVSVSFIAEQETHTLQFTVLAQEKIDLSPLIVFLALLCLLEGAAIVYVAGYLRKNHKRHSAAAVVPTFLLAVILPAHAVLLCIVLGAVCIIETTALCLLLRKALKRETQDEKLKQET